MKEIVESYFKQRSLVNHQLMSYNDCIPSGDGRLSRMERIIRHIRVGTDEPVEDLPGGEEAGGCIKLDVLDKTTKAFAVRESEIKGGLAKWNYVT